MTTISTRNHADRRAPPAREPSSDRECEGKRRADPAARRSGARQPLLVALSALALIGVGIWSLQRLPVDAYPDVSPPASR